MVLSLVQCRTMNVDHLLAQYEYPLHKEDIATAPASPRDCAKLLIYNRTTGKTSFDTFLHLDTHIPKGALLVLNDTKVIPARLPVFLATGGKVELLCLSYDKKTKTVRALSPRILPPNEAVHITSQDTLTVINKCDAIYTLTLTSRISFETLLTRHGTTPIPPYLKHTQLTEHDLREKYQTIFAKHAGSVAAPTASLHFTKRLMAKLKKARIETAYVTLHVGMGTFAPLTERELSSGELHDEYFALPPETITKIQRAKREGRPVITVGTTATRALETAFTDKRVKTSGTTSLFIREGYTWKVVDGMITNFHVPQSSLLMLVATLTGREKLFELYRTARAHGFRFLSFGDGMLIK